MAYWYNTNTGAVEQGENTDSKSYLLGPYATEAEARSALEKARANTEKWDAEDREFNGED